MFVLLGFSMMNQQSFIYNFLLSPRFRIWRYLALITFFIIISINQAVVGYKDIIPLMGNKIYWVVAFTILMYVVTIFIILKIVIKKLLAGKYLLFVINIILCALLYIAVSNVVYDSYIPSYSFFHEEIIVDNISAFTIYILCVSGIIIPVFLRNWLISNQHLNQLKIKRESSLVEQFKEQINPTSFFKILNRSGSFIKTDPDKASAMLMKLGQVLRYQLYDCNREQVLLSTEISFLKNFLELEKLHSPNFNYTLNVEGNINGVFVFTSVLLPYVQSGINAVENEDVLHTLDIRLSCIGGAVCITLEIFGCNNILLQKELQKVKERLKALYKDSYELAVKSSAANEKLEVILQLNS